MRQINPYNFVPLESVPDRSEGYPGKLKFHEGRYSGMLKCTLEALSPLISVDQRNPRLYQLKDTDETLLKFKSGQRRGELCPEIKCFNFLRNRHGQVFLQGTSLKGMIRSVYEVITNSCLKLASTIGYKDVGGHKNAECNGIHKLCPACRLFGTIEGDKLHCQGRVVFIDAFLVEGNLTPEPPISNRSPSSKPFHFLKVLSSPRPSHHPTYGKKGQRNGPIAGRKFYYHHGKDSKFFVNEHEACRSIAIEQYAPVETKFGFEVYVENLDKEEFEYLVLALELYEGLGHKIGLGKAIGLGSCNITIDRKQSSITKGSGRYKDWKAAADTTWHSLKKDKKELPDALIEVLRLNKEDDDGEIGYPANFRNYPNQPIDAKGFFSEDTKADEQAPQPNTAKTGECSRCPIAAATKPPEEPPPKVSQDQEAAWLKEIYDDELVFVDIQGKEIVKRRQACQSKKKLQEVGKWFVLWGTTASRRVL
jgi:CRISPR/Cas system CSM-associated protein Csm3 (group 7 of RAMP superfamily)